MILELLGWLAVGTVGAFLLFLIIEIGALMTEADHARPSVWIMKVVDFRTKINYYAMYGLTLVADLARWLKELVLKLRDWIFTWIPRAIFVKAFRDLGTSFRRAARIFDGCWDGFSDALQVSRFKVLSLAVVVVAVASVPVAAHLATEQLGFNHTVTVVLQQGAEFVYSAAHETVEILWDGFGIPRAVAWFLSFFFGWIPYAHLRQAAVAVYARLFDLAIAPFFGLHIGLCDAVFSDDGFFSDANTLVACKRLGGRVLYGILVGCIVLGVFLWKYLQSLLRACGCADFEDAALAAGGFQRGDAPDGDGGPDDKDGSDGGSEDGGDKLRPSRSVGQRGRGRPKTVPVVQS